MRKTQSETAPRTTWVKPWMAYAFLITAVFLAYGNIYSNQFLFDDDQLIVSNSFLRPQTPFMSIFFTSLGGGSGIPNDFYRPMQSILYIFVASLGGIRPFGFHLLNLSLHTANVVLVYTLGRKVGFNGLAVFLAALLWGLHPIHTEAVTYMSATADPLYSLFCLLGILLLLPDFTQKRIAWASLCMVFGLMSKESAAVFPLLAGSTLFLVSKKRLEIKTYARLWPFVALALFYLLLRKTLLNVQDQDLSLLANTYFQDYAHHLNYRFYTFLATIPLYVILLARPAGLHLERQFPVYTSFNHPENYVGLGILLLSLAIVFWGRGRRALPLSWGLLWCASAYSIYSGLVIPLNAVFLEHWVYLPSAGLFLGLGQGAATMATNWRQRFMRGGVVTCALVLAAFYGLAVWKQNEIWHDALTFYPYVLNFEPSVRSMTNLGKAYMDQKNWPLALKYLRESIRRNDVMPEAHQNIAFVLTHQSEEWRQNPQPVIWELKRALEINSNFLPATDGLAWIYNQIGDHKEEAFYEQRSRDLRQLISRPNAK